MMHATHTLGVAMPALQIKSPPYAATNALDDELMVRQRFEMGWEGCMAGMSLFVGPRGCIRHP